MSTSLKSKGLYAFPRQAVLYVIDRCWMNSKFLRKRYNISSPIFSKDTFYISNITSSKNRIVVSLPFWVSTFQAFISRIISISAYKKMFGITAGRIVTFVKNTKMGIYVKSKVSARTNSVSEPTLAMNADCSITSFVFNPAPYPATSYVVYLDIILNKFFKKFAITEDIRVETPFLFLKVPEKTSPPPKSIMVHTQASGLWPSFGTPLDRTSPLLYNSSCVHTAPVYSLLQQWGKSVYC